MSDSKKIDLGRGLSGGFVRFQELMRHRVREILLVSSLYDAFILGEDGHLYEMLLEEYMELNLSNTPGITRVSSGANALELAAREGRFDLIITTLRLEDMYALDFARKLRAEGVSTPLVLLTYDNRELEDLTERHDVSAFDKVFLWQGNFRILLAIIKCIEDFMNVARDTRIAGVQSIILIEDSIKFYSSYLPTIYTMIMRHSQNVIAEGVNLPHKMLRMRARPKILLCENYEVAWNYYETYHDSILGIISDIHFPRKGQKDPRAGIKFARAVKEHHRDIPILLQSNDEERCTEAHEVGASFLMKDDPRLLHKLQRFMKQYFSFGEFVFKLRDGTSVGTARDLRELEQMLHTIPEESLLLHGEANHFSNWLKARTEFFLAHKLRPRKITDYKSPEDLRKALLSYIRDYQISQHRGTIIDFNPQEFDSEYSFARFGGGSLGGKGRGLAFANTLINTYGIRNAIPDIEISVPPTLVLETNIFDEFLELNDLGEFAFRCEDDDEIGNRFVRGRLPQHVVNILREYLRLTRYPLAVRSSSLLEDSQYQPFAGVYETFMLPNNHAGLEIRLVELTSAIKRVYASTFSKHAKAYIAATPYRLEDEKMAVVIQKLVGRSHGNRFYPDFSGVGRSYNFYPIHPMNPEDGIASVALGLGATVVEGGAVIRFCPKYPRHLVQLSNVSDSLEYSQKEFFALNMPDPQAKRDHTRETRLLKLGLNVAEDDGVLGYMGSTYSPENESISDGISRPGIRVVTFAPILKSDFFPLPKILQQILDTGRRGMSSPIEIEFSVNLETPPGQPREFRLVQLRPMVISQEREQLAIGAFDQQELLCHSTQVMGHGEIRNIRDIVFVNRESFDRSKSTLVADEIARFNALMLKDKRQYLLIGVGRWGSADPWLGIPVRWESITGARVIVEAGFKDMKVTPSQGTHFFQNLNAFRIGYFTVNPSNSNSADFVDWSWLSELPITKRGKFVKHVALDSPVTIRMNGHACEGVIVKPSA